MANAPKMEDFPTITKWLKALEKYGDAKRGARASNAPQLKKSRKNSKKDLNKYDPSTQYTRYRTGPPVKPSLKQGMEDWYSIPRNKREKINKEYRASLRDWRKTQEKSGGISRQESKIIDSINIDRRDIGLGSMSNTELARSIARDRTSRSIYKSKYLALEELERRRGKGDTTIDEVLRREEKDYKDYIAKNPPKIKIKLRNNKGGVITKNKPRNGYTDYRSKGMIHTTEVKRG